MYRTLYLVILLAVCSLSAYGVTYTKADSLKVVRLLNDGAAQPAGTNLMLYYGRRLEGVPYVAHTLEVNDREQLVVNLRGLDCSTFVETVFALALTTAHGSVRWDDFCRWLETMRYREGRVDGYPSRNHYFLWWVESNERRGLVSLPMKKLADDAAKENYPHARRQVIDIDYMSTHPSLYKMLKGNRKDIAAIAALEKESRGKVMMYIPADKTGLSEKQLKYVRTGDILAICTKKKGLDTSHVGIASWGKDGKLHLLNASQIHKKVIMEPMTLRQYMSKHPTQLGIWVIRPGL